MPISKKRTKAFIFATALLAGVSAAAADDLVTRADWGAKPALAGQRPHEIERITLHHTGVQASSKRSLEAKLRSLQRFSQSNEKLADGRRKSVWADVPYHFYISADGRLGEGRDLRFAGDTNTSYDPAGHIGIVLEGNFEMENPTQAQELTLAVLLVRLMREHGLTSADIGTHRHFASTACPGRNLEARMPAILKSVVR